MGVPKLRFKADDGSDFPDWEEKTLGEVFIEIKEKNRSELPVLSVQQGVGTVLRDSSERRIAYNKNSLNNYKAMRKGDFIIHLRSFEGGLECSNHDGISSPAYRILRSNEILSDAFKDYFRSYTFIKGKLSDSVVGIRDGKNIDMPTFWEIQISIPSLPEQHKIADLLSAVDDVIAAQEAEVAAWEKRKKGVMQKLFSQEVRFKADDGSDFPDWESTTVGELFTFVTEKNESGRISDVITNSAEHGLIPQREYFDKDIAVEGNTEGYTVIHKGDFVYNPRKSTIAPFGPFNIYERDEVGIVSPLYTCLTPRDGETAPYLSWYFKTSRWHRYIVTHGAQGGARHDRVGMTNALMKGIPVMLPSLPEQRKIADCLTSLDDVIAKAKDELDAWRELKKGLLQQMFV
mgnify:CR=1 FL=1